MVDGFDCAVPAPAGFGSLSVMRAMDHSTQPRERGRGLRKMRDS